MAGYAGNEEEGSKGTPLTELKSKYQVVINEAV